MALKVSMKVADLLVTLFVMGGTLLLHWRLTVFEAALKRAGWTLLFVRPVAAHGLSQKIGSDGWASNMPVSSMLRHEIDVSWSMAHRADSRSS